MMVLVHMAMNASVRLCNPLLQQPKFKKYEVAI